MPEVIPDDVDVTRPARVPITDPTLGIDVTTAPQGDPPHRLVTIGDSLFHGFQNGAVYQTNLSVPAIIAYELGALDRFRYPTYGGPGGLPVNLELLLRELHRRHGDQLSWWELPAALFTARQWMDELEDYWERGPGAVVPELSGVNDNLAMYGWDVRDALAQTAQACHDRLVKPKDDLVSQIIENNTERAALRVYPTALPEQRTRTVLALAAELGEDDRGGDAGIETLVVFLGANNALGAVTKLKVRWSREGYTDLTRKGAFTVWRPTHFRSELELLAKQVADIRARHVIWCTVPHVTIPPISRGVGTKIKPGSRYFPYYTRPWISDRAFDPGHDPHLTADEARAVDCAIDGYNDAITDAVKAARNAGRDWYLMDVAGVLDRLADRRYINDPAARPPWWQPYRLPPVLASLQPPLTSRFLTSDGHGGRADGGLFSLDGVHPTTVGYGLLANEIMQVMRLAGVRFLRPDGVTARPDPVTVDFARLMHRDTLITHPPQNLTSGLGVLGWADEVLDVLRRMLPF